jgi:P27 family predicted phage terminase small subunit
MARGRRREPDALKEIKGNPGKRPVAPDPAPETTPAAAIAMKPPAKLSAGGLAIWREIAPELQRLNFLRHSDRQTFARYCETLARYWNVTRQLKSKDLTYWTESAHGKLKRVNPLFQVENWLERRLVPLEDRFGLSPAARQQILLRLANAPGQLPLDMPAATDPKPGAPGAEAPLLQPQSPVGMLSAASSKVH